MCVIPYLFIYFIHFAKISRNFRVVIMGCWGKCTALYFKLAMRSQTRTVSVSVNIFKLLLTATVRTNKLNIVFGLHMNTFRPQKRTNPSRPSF